MLFLILVITLCSVLFIALFRYNISVKEAFKIEESRSQEKIILLKLTTDNTTGTELIKEIIVNNTGTITSQIKAAYIDNDLKCDPSDYGNTYINSKTDKSINLLPADIPYNRTQKITLVTERGVKSTDYQWRLKGEDEPTEPTYVQRPQTGPLLLNFEKFYYALSQDGVYDSDSWKPGWSVEKGTEVVWNVTVTNVDDRTITLNQYSCLTLEATDGVSAQLPYYIEPPGNQNILSIEYNETVSLIYIWTTPRTTAMRTADLYNPPDDKPYQCKVFLTFFGIFHEKDDTTKPYGQTIPFEAVLVRAPQMVISAPDPTTIAAGSQMTSTITVTVRNIYGELAVNTPIFFDTTLGELSDSEVYTNAFGVASVVLHPGIDIGTATVTATYGDLRISTSVIIASGTLILAADPSVIPIDSTSSIRATVQFNGPLAGEQVNFLAMPSNLGLLQSPVVTDTEGQAVSTFAPTSTGFVEITATWADQIQTTTLRITDNISVTPLSATLTAGSAQAYTATAYDSFGNSLGDVTGSVVWSIDAGAGGSWAANVYTSSLAGTWGVTGTYGGVFASSSLTVT